MNFPNSELEILAERVEKLETQNRWWKVASFVSALF
jgi:hypothetical protein